MEKSSLNRARDVYASAATHAIEADLIADRALKLAVAAHENAGADVAAITKAYELTIRAHMLRDHATKMFLDAECAKRKYRGLLEEYYPPPRKI